MDPFQQLDNMMGLGFDNDPFLGRMMRSEFRKDPLSEMNKFSDRTFYSNIVHKGMHKKAAEGSYVSQSFVSSTKMGPDGKVYS